MSAHQYFRTAPQAIMIATTIFVSLPALVEAQQTLPPLRTNASVFDSEIYKDLYSTEEMRSVFSDERLIAYWLKYEVELANAQASLGVIPSAAALAIAAAATPDKIDIQKLRVRTNSVGRPIEPLISQVSAIGGKAVADYLHWGSTTQDVMDTATVLQIRDGLQIIQRDLRTLILILADLAAKHRATPTVARSNGQDAIPTTFGMLIASYMVELRRNSERLDAASRRVLVGQYGSAVGTLSSAGPDGLNVRAALMHRLGLGEPELSWNASRDNFAEVIQVLALIDGCLNRVATDVNLWSRTADNSVNEGEGGPSSTMPQKRNPRTSEFIGGIAHLASMRSAGALAMLDQSETRQGAPWISEWSTIPEMFMLTGASLARANGLFRNLIVRPDVMMERFNDSKGYVMAEAVVVHIAPKIGRGEAEDLIRTAIKEAPAGVSFKEVIQRSRKLSDLIGESNLDKVLDPRNYLGAAPIMVDAAVARTRAALH